MALAPSTHLHSLQIPLFPGCTCDHSDIHEFDNVHHAYFAPSIVLPENYPEECSNCKKTFVGKLEKGETFDKNKMVKLTASKMGRACKNATLRSDHPCVYALCPLCFKKAELELIHQEEEAAKKKQKTNEGLVATPGRSRRGGEKRNVTPAAGN